MQNVLMGNSWSGYLFAYCFHQVELKFEELIFVEGPKPGKPQKQNTQSKERIKLNQNIMLSPIHMTLIRMCLLSPLCYQRFQDVT